MFPLHANIFFMRGPRPQFAHTPDHTALPLYPAVPPGHCTQRPPARHPVHGAPLCPSAQAFCSLLIPRCLLNSYLILRNHPGAESWHSYSAHMAPVQVDKGEQLTCHTSKRTTQRAPPQDQPFCFRISLSPRLRAMPCVLDLRAGGATQGGWAGGPAHHLTQACSPAHPPSPPRSTPSLAARPRPLAAPLRQRT